MKRGICLLLALMLLLSGCGGADQDATQQTTTVPDTEPTHPGYYLPGSEVETQSGGALLAYSLPFTVDKIYTVGMNLLLVQEMPTLKMAVLGGQKLTPVAEATVPVQLSDGDAYRVLANGVVFYIKKDNAVTYLDGSLHEIDTLVLPEGISGDPVISANGAVFYVEEKQIRCIDPEVGVPRLIKDVSGEEILLTGSWFDGKVLSYSYVDLYGSKNHIYISATTGELLADQALMQMTTWQDRYFAQWQDGIVTEYIFGTLESDPQSLNFDGDYTISALLPLNCVLYKNEEGSKLFICDLTTGSAAYNIDLLQIVEASAFCGDSKRNCVWFTAKDREIQYLYCWDHTKSPSAQEVVITGEVYTASSPDSDGLALCAEQAAGLKSTYGIDVRIWQDAVQEQGDHLLTPEHQVPAIRSALSKLEEICAQFPEGFLKTSGNATSSGRLRLCIVRSVDENQPSVRFWKNGQMYIVIATDADIQREFLLSLGDAVISRVLGNSAKMDYWTSWNPKGFRYGTENEKYLEEDSRAFVDAQAMLSLTEDRSRMFAYAMTDGEEACFASDAMQGKLKLLCQAIREAYRLKRYAEDLPWEQYLDESLAYKK